MSTTPPPRPAAGPVPVSATAQIVRGFHPGWFGAVMGTAIVGVIAYQNPGSEPTLSRAAHGVGLGFVLAAWVAAVLIAVPYLARIVHHPDAALADLRHPVLGALYGTFAGAIVVLAVATATVGGSLLSAHGVTAVVAVLAALGGVLAFATGVLFTYVLFTSEGLAADAANGGWFIPPVVSIIIPLTLIPLVPHVGESAGRLLLLTGYAGLGVGLFLFLLVAAVLFGRLVFHPLPPAQLAPSLWIGLGPIGVGSLALPRLAAAGQPYWGAEAATVQRLSTLAAAILWGFGLWWLATAAILLARYLRRGRLPYGVGVWAFTFPLGAYTAATLQLARSWPSHPLEWAAAALLVLLAGFWIAAPPAPSVRSEPEPPGGAEAATIRRRPDQARGACPTPAPQRGSPTSFTRRHSAFPLVVCEPERYYHACMLGASCVFAWRPRHIRFESSIGAGNGGCKDVQTSVRGSLTMREHASAKLGIRSRTQLADRLSQGLSMPRRRALEVAMLRDDASGEPLDSRAVAVAVRVLIGQSFETGRRSR